MPKFNLWRFAKTFLRNHFWAPVINMDTLQSFWCGRPSRKYQETNICSRYSTSSDVHCVYILDSYLCCGSPRAGPLHETRRACRRNISIAQSVNPETPKMKKNIKRCLYEKSQNYQNVTARGTFSTLIHLFSFGKLMSNWYLELSKKKTTHFLAKPRRGWKALKYFVADL